MKTKAIITATTEETAVKITVLASTKLHTRWEHARFRNQVVDSMHAALSPKFHASQIKIR